jgi:hypothetical protein
VAADWKGGEGGDKNTLAQQKREKLGIEPLQEIAKATQRIVEEIENKY